MREILGRTLYFPMVTGHTSYFQKAICPLETTAENAKNGLDPALGAFQ